MSLLRSVLAAFEGVHGPMSLGDLSRQLDIETSALEGMLDFWVRKGRLRAIEPGAPSDGCQVAGCAQCSASGACPVMFHLPRRYVLVE